MPFNNKGEWKPNRKQEEFLAIPLSVKEGFYGGGAGSGKSEVLLAYPIIHKWHENPRFKQVFMRRTCPELRNEIVPRAKLLYRPFNADYNKSEMTFTFPRLDQYGSGLKNDGAIIFLGHCENEDDVHNYDTMEINLFTPDELTSLIEWQYLYVGFERVRAPRDSGLPAIIRAAGMPGGIGHGWVKRRFVDPAPKGGKIIVGKGDNKRIFIFATQADNKEHIDPNYAQSLAALPEAEKQAKLYGSFDAYLGQVFDEFRDRKYPDEPDNALHVITTFTPPEWWPKIVVGDWGYEANTWIGYGAISPDRRLYVYREQVWKKVKIEEWAPYVKEWCDKENPRVVRFCKSAGQDRGQEHTIQQQIEDALQRPIDLTNSSRGSRVAGKALLHEYLRWKPKPIIRNDPKTYNEEHAQWIFRNRGLKEYKSYLSSFDSIEQETNIPKLLIMDNCSHVIAAIKTCNYAKSKDGIPAEDVAEFDGDDPYDGIRYMVDAADRYFDESASEFEKIQKRDELLQALARNNDMTSFYRRSRELELVDKFRPMSRYSHRR